MRSRGVPRSRFRDGLTTMLAGLASAAALGGCASLTAPDFLESTPSDLRGEPHRPVASADYDVLVGSLASQEGRLPDALAAFQRAAEKDPGSAYLQRTLGRLSAQLDDLDAALAYGERAVELDPDDRGSRLFLGRLHRIRRDVGGAEAVLLDADGQPVDDEAALLLYQVYLEGNRHERALAMAEGLVEREPDNLGGHMAAATAYERMGRPADSEAALRRALEYHPGRFVLYSRLARMRRASGDRAGEIAVYREVLAQHPDHYGTLVSLADAQVAVEDIEGAIDTYSLILTRYPDDLQSVRRLATLEFAAGRSEDAARRLEAALERNPQRQELAYALGQVWRGVGDEDKAIVAFRRVDASHEVYPESLLQIAEILESREQYAEALVEVETARALNPSRPLDFHTAALRWRAGDFDGGVELLESMLAESPDDDEVLYQLGVLYGMAKRVDESLVYMRRTLEANPENAHALNYIGYTWAERGENLDAAEEMIQRALSLRPNDGYITDSLGWVYYMRARPLIGAGDVADGRALLEQAREHLALAAELTGGDPVVSEHLGDVHVLLDQKERALEFYEEALRLEPRVEEQPDLMEKLETLRRELLAR